MEYFDSVYVCTDLLLGSPCFWWPWMLFGFFGMWVWLAARWTCLLTWVSQIFFVGWAGVGVDDFVLLEQQPL